VPKTYRVTVTGRPSEAALEALRQGIELSDGPTRPARVGLVRGGTRASVLEIALTQGRNRQVRRMCASVGHKVRRLVRVAIGGLELGDLKVGECRKLVAEDLRRLSFAGHV
jgi:pseudouridine synthase